MTSVFAIGCNQEFLLGVAEDNPYYAIISELIHDRGRYHIETSPLIYTANQWTGFYMITASVMKSYKTEYFHSFILTIFDTL